MRMASRFSSSWPILSLTPWFPRWGYSAGGPYPTLRRCSTTKASPFPCATNAVYLPWCGSASTCSLARAATVESASPSATSTDCGNQIKANRKKMIFKNGNSTFNHFNLTARISTGPTGSDPIDASARKDSKEPTAMLGSATGRATVLTSVHRPRRWLPSPSALLWPDSSQVSNRNRLH